MKRSTISRCCASSTMPAAAEARQQRQRQVLAHRSCRARCPRPCGPRCRSRARRRWRRAARPDAHGRPSSAHRRRRRGRSAPKTSARGLGAARAEQPGKADDLARARPRSSTSLHRAGRRARSLRREQRLRRPCACCARSRSCALRRLLRSRPSIGATRSSLPIVAHVGGAHGAAVAHDGDAVADRVELVELVARRRSPTRPRP